MQDFIILDRCYHCCQAYWSELSDTCPKCGCLYVVHGFDVEIINSIPDEYWRDMEEELCRCFDD